MMIANLAVTWRQTLADVALISAAVTAVLVLWARLFAGPIGKWVDARITKFVEPLHSDVTEMRAQNADQHHAIEMKLEKLATRLDDHLSVNQGDGR